jgi:hypothetical protein
MSGFPDRRTVRARAVGLLAAATGLALFVYSVRAVGFGQVLDDIRQLGAGFLLVLALSGLRDVCRTLSWMRCVRSPHRLRFADTFAARQIGEALGNVTPLGLFASEPAKAMLVRNQVPLVQGLSALAVDQLFYTISVILLIGAGTITLLATFPVPSGVRVIGIATIAAILVFIVALVAVARRQPRISGRLMRLLARAGASDRAIHRLADPALAIEQRIYEFYSQQPGQLLPIVILLTAFHAAAVAEVYATLWLISDAGPPTVLTAFILEAVNRLITVVFKFVPLRLGVDEAGTGLMTGVLQLGPAAGVTLAIVRKARILSWSAVGIALLVYRGVSLRGLIDGVRAVEGSAGTR